MAGENKPAVQVKELYQAGIVVRDLQASIKLYEELLGIGPWEVMHIKSEWFSSLTYKGKPVGKASFMTGTAMAGSLQLELIQPVEGDLPFADFLNEVGGGLHHLGHVRVPDVDAVVADMEAQGFPCIFAGATTGTKFAYVDMSKSLGVIVELIQAPQDK